MDFIGTRNLESFVRGVLEREEGEAGPDLPLLGRVTMRKFLAQGVIRALDVRFRSPLVSRDAATIDRRRTAA